MNVQYQWLIKWHTNAYNLNDDASQFTEKSKVTSHELPNYPWCVPQVSRVTKFSDWTASPLCIPEVLLCVVASECSSKVMLQSAPPEWYQVATLERDSDLTLQPETSNSPNLFTKSASSSLRDLQEGLLKLILVWGLCPRALGRRTPRPLTTFTAVRPHRSIHVMTLHRSINHQGNN